MCGIAGFLGSTEATPVLLGALRRLEYRGYDSCGITTLNAGRFETRRTVGKFDLLAAAIDEQPVIGTVGIGHNRWATHGEPTLANAHPHQTSAVSVVHNGIIENYRELRSELSERGYPCTTETDTETASKLCHRFLDEGHTPEESARLTVNALRGAFALVFLFQSEENLLFAARRGSPLVIGHGNGEMFIASDVVALVGLTDTATHLEDGDCAVVSRQGVKVTDFEGRTIDRPAVKIGITEDDADKCGHPHFMAKEIFEQPAVLAKQLSEYLDQNGRIRLPDGMPKFTEIDKIALIACGTANFACQVGAYWFEQLAGIPARAEIASEFRYRDSVLDDRTLAILVSQSGETADTLAALRHVKTAGCPNVAVLNSTTSTMAREASAVLPIHAGLEVGVASTKAFTCQLSAILLQALTAAEEKGQLDRASLERLLLQVRSLPILVNTALHGSQQIAEIAGRIALYRSALFAGRGTMYPIALEGALKLKEISYIHAEGIATGELKHGPIALVTKDLPVVVLAPPGQLLEKSLSNLEEVRARKGKVILISDEGTVRRHEREVWSSVTVIDSDPLLSPLLYTIPLQLLAYHAAVALNTDVDQPRNLAKSVTVE